jgi:hypothetical protein
VAYLYADDIAILYSANKYEELKIKMEDDLQLLTNWTASIKLSINHEKTTAMLIKSNILLDVRFENIKIDFVDNFKYLGLILDKDLTFSLHITRLKGRISRIAGLFRRLKDILSFPVWRMFFFCIVSKPGIVWHQCLGSDLPLFDKQHTESSK